MKLKPALARSAIMVACAVALAAGVSAQAKTLNWTLHDVTFDDGGAARGTFSTDSSTGDVTALDITTTAGSVLPGASYDDSSGFLLFNNFHSAPSFIVITVNNNTYTPYLNLAFYDPLTNPNTLDSLEAFGPLSGSWEYSSGQAIRDVTNGYASTAPEPAAWALMLIGVGGVGGMVRRVRRQIAANA